MNYQKIEYYLSRPRIARYLVATQGNTTLAYELYLDNLRLAQAFHPMIGLLEVALRNALNERLTHYFGDPDWIIHQKQGFMVDKRLKRFDRREKKTVLNTYLKDQVAQAEQSIRRIHQAVTPGKVIAELTFGFWTSLFDKTEYKILQGQPIQIFTQLPSSTSRADIATALNEIRTLRNRMNHNEPLCFSGSQYDCQPTYLVYQRMKNILAWLHQDLLYWTAPVDSVEQQIKIMDAKYL